jgi:universal stress protein family protein
MTMIKNILFPVDFSPACMAMAPFVKKGAAMFSAEVTLLHALEPPYIAACGSPKFHSTAKLHGCRRLTSNLVYLLGMTSFLREHGENCGGLPTVYLAAHFG